MLKRLLMEIKKETKIVVNGKQYYDLEEVPEAFREMVKAKLEAARTGAEQTGTSKVTISKDLQFQFQAGAGLTEFIKLLVKISQPPKNRKPAGINAAAEPPAGPENPEVPAEPLRAGAIKPSSSGRFLLLTAVILSVLYFLFR